MQQQLAWLPGWSLNQRVVTSLLGLLEVVEPVSDLGVDNDVAHLDVLQQLVPLDHVPKGREPTVLQLPSTHQHADVTNCHTRAEPTVTPTTQQSQAYNNTAMLHLSAG
jgi:hypothetical protein